MTGSLESLDALIDSPEFASCLAYAKSLLSRLETAGPFRLQSVLDETAGFFSQLKTQNPAVYGALKLYEKRIYETAYYKETGHRIILE